MLQSLLVRRVEYRTVGPLIDLETLVQYGMVRSWLGLGSNRNLSTFNKSTVIVTACQVNSVSRNEGVMKQNLQCPNHPNK